MAEWGRGVAAGYCSHMQGRGRAVGPNRAAACGGSRVRGNAPHSGA